MLENELKEYHWYVARHYVYNKKGTIFQYRGRSPKYHRNGAYAVYRGSYYLNSNATHWDNEEPYFDTYNLVERETIDAEVQEYLLDREFYVGFYEQSQKLLNS